MRSSSDAPRPDGPEARDDLVDAFLTASRVLVGVAARSLAVSEPDVTLPQYRALVVLSERGEQRVSSLAEALDIHPSTATRLCDRLAAKHLVVRGASPTSRREVTVDISARGRALLTTVTLRRRAEIARIVEQLPGEVGSQLIEVLQELARVAGEVPDDAWRLGWST